MTEQYKKLLEQGLEYQNFVADLFWEKFQINLTHYRSKWYQGKGENVQGIEIKYNSPRALGVDGIPTGNIFIEIAEKSDKWRPKWTPSGCFREDNSWLFITGDFEEVFIFGKKDLQRISEHKTIHQNETSKFFLLNKEEREKYSLKVIKIEQK